MGDYVNIEDFRKESKRREFKEKVSKKLQDGKTFVMNNKETIMAATPIVIGGLATATKMLNKRRNIREQKELKNLYCYDRSLGHYWKLRRELSNKEWLEIDARKKNGERLSDILAEMRVLK